MSIRIKRVYDEVGREDGYRVLVDRVWPRGMSRERAAIDEWRKDLAPSRELRQWFAHDPVRWEGFRQRYFDELGAMGREALDGLRRQAGYRGVTLVYAARDRSYNNAVALREYLEAEQ